MDVLPQSELVQQVGLLGYMLLLCVGTGLALFAWMVKQLVGAATGLTKRLGDSVEKLSEHESTEMVLLERLSDTLEANLQITKEIRGEMARNPERNGR